MRESHPPHSTSLAAKDRHILQNCAVAKETAISWAAPIDVKTREDTISAGNVK